MLKFLKGSKRKYSISSKGYIINNKSNKRVAIFPNTKGYLRSHIRLNNKSVQHYIHRLVAQHFIPNPQDLPEVNHDDGNKSNNDYSNLWWCTSSQNKNHAYKIGLRGRLKVDQYTLEGVFIKSWPSVKAVVKELGIGQQHLCKCLRGVKKTGFGYIWKEGSGSFRKKNRTSRED